MLFRRVVARAGIGVWRNRVGVLLALIATTGVAAYAGMNAAGMSPLPLSAGGVGPGSTAASTDCADAAIAAIANKSPNAVQGAYQCMDPNFQQRVPEQVFVQQMQAQALPNVNNVARVGDYRAPQGGTMVYYAVDTNGQSIGYIVYLGIDGKVQKIE